MNVNGLDDAGEGDQQDAQQGKSFRCGVSG